MKETSLRKSFSFSSFHCRYFCHFLRKPQMQISLEPLLRKFFFWYGGFAYRWRWPLFLVPLILTPFLGIGFIWYRELRVYDPAYVFTPRDARWKHEFYAFARLWPLKENEFIPGKSFEMNRFVNILIKAADKGSIFRDEILDEIEKLNQYMMYNITIETEGKDGAPKFNLTYQDLCLNYEWNCGGNEHIRMFKEMSKLGKVIDLKFPRGGNQDTPVYLGSAIGDIVLNKSDNTVAEAKITQLFYFLKQSDTVRPYSTAFEYAAEKYLLHEYKSDLITYSFAHYQSLEDGLDENAQRFVPNFVISFTSLSLFCLSCAFVLRTKQRVKGIDWIRSKPWIAVCGLFNTLISLISAFGFMMLLGIPYNVINTIIPFLIITIGIDDMFIMNACWDQTDRSLSVEERMSVMMMHAGVAVSITNVTDILSFAIGCYTELPGIEMFCLYACFSVLFCYVYQLTYFTGFMAIVGIMEEEKLHCIFFYKMDEQKVHPSESTQTFAAEKKDELQLTTIEINSENSLSAPPLPPKEPLPHEKRHATHANNMVHKFFSNQYAPFIMRNEIRLIAGILYFIYACGAWHGCMNYREGLEPNHLVTESHYIAQYFEDMKLFWKVGPQMHVAILNPPNLINPVEREKLMATIRAFENTEYTMGREGTVFFFLEYLNYLDQLNAELENTEKIWKKKLLSWLKFTGASNQWKADIVYNKTTEQFEAFRMQIALKNIVEPNQHKLAAELLRKIADEQPFKIEIYHEAFPFADQYIIIFPSTIRNVGMSLICMSGIALLLIPSFPSAVFIMVSIVSIAIGVFGYMTHWGVNLDAVSMISLIMSIGFAVDLSAHIVYAFVTADGNSVERVKGALSHLGWPIFQGAFSTIMGISVLYTVDAYIILTFFKTIWLTMVIGLLHGLIFIPILLSIIPIGVFHVHGTKDPH